MIRIDELGFEGEVNDIPLQILAERDQVTHAWWFTSNNHIPLGWSKETINRHAEAVGKAEKIEIYDGSSVLVIFDTHPNLTQLGRFVELCIATTHDVQT